MKWNSKKSAVYYRKINSKHTHNKSKVEDIQTKPYAL